MTEPEVKVEPQTAPALPEAQSEPAETPQETSPLTRDEVAAIIEEKVSARQAEIDKQLEAAYKTLRRGEAKSDTLVKKVERLEQEQFENSLRGMEPQQQEIEKLKRQTQQAQSPSVDPNAELASFNAYARSVLEEESISDKDPVLTEWFQKYAEAGQTASDWKIALTRAVAKVRTEESKKARSESAEREKKAREEERAKLRNENRQAEGKVDKGTPASATAQKNFLTMSSEELEAFEKSRKR